jgi:tripeptidyl-peptidase-1
MTDGDVGRGSGDKTAVAVCSFLNNYYQASDLSSFRQQFNLPENGFTSKDVPNDQPHSPPGIEAQLDTQWASVAGININTEYWSTAGTQPNATEPDNEPYVAFMVLLAADASPPGVVSMSYGDDEYSVSPAYAVRASVEMMKAGARGITIVVATGDIGAGCSPDGSKDFVPTFPATIPYVTSVGAVEGGTPGQSPTGEAGSTFSGGGFSNVYAAPDFQKEALARYFFVANASLPPKSHWNPSGRGFPDISAQGTDFLVINEAIPTPVSGTSAATPAIAGLMALVNSVRSGANKAPLGWMNPLLYKVAASNADNRINDATSGVNDNCNPSDGAGFPAAQGWDAVTGWGSPNYGLLKGFLSA